LVNNIFIYIRAKTETVTEMEKVVEEHTGVELTALQLINVYNVC
jgi:hypothetical protein